MDWSQQTITSQLSRLRDSDSKVFGSERHHFQLNPIIPEAEILEFERRHQVTLPGDYRFFLVDVGNGGAGPYYGIFPLGHMDDDFTLRRWHEHDGIIGTLSEPFPHQAAWNDLTGMPPEDLLEDNEAEYDRQTELFGARYFSAINGAFPICHEGCAIRVLLVVTGPHAGKLWRDSRSENTGITPLFLRNGAAATFSGWYEEWLEAK